MIKKNHEFFQWFEKKKQRKKGRNDTHLIIPILCISRRWVRTVSAPMMMNCWRNRPLSLTPWSGKFPTSIVLLWPPLSFLPRNFSFWTLFPVPSPFSVLTTILLIFLLSYFLNFSLSLGSFQSFSARGRRAWQWRIWLSMPRRPSMAGPFLSVWWPCLVRRTIFSRRFWSPGASASAGRSFFPRLTPFVWRLSSPHRRSWPVRWMSWHWWYLGKQWTFLYRIH